MDDVRLKKLKYRAWHRGFVEADIVLGGFADQRLADLDGGELDEFEALLEQPDPDLYAWIVGTATPPERFEGGVLKLIQDFRFRVRPNVGQGA